MPTVTRKYDQGLVDSRDRSDLQDGEMQVCTGGFYKPSDRRLHKLDGRSEFGDTGSGVKIDGTYLAEFDSAADQILVLSGGVLYKAPADGSGSFTDTGATVTGTTLSGAHANDRHYLCTGNENLVFESDGTVRGMGMKAPVEGMSFTNPSSGVSVRPTADDSAFTGGSKMYDGDMDTFGYVYHEAAGSTTSVFSSFAANTTVDARFLQVFWSLRSAGAGGAGKGAGQMDWLIGGDGGGESSPGFSVKITFEISEDMDQPTPTWTAFKTATYDRAYPLNVASVEFDDTGIDAAVYLGFRAKIEYIDGTKAAGLIIRDVRLIIGSDSTLVSVTNMKYCVTEYDEVRGLEGPPGDILDTGVFTNKNAVILTLPTVNVNSTATHFLIYRTPDNGTDTQLGLIGEVPVSATYFMDDFTQYGVLVQPTGKPLDWLQITANGKTLNFVANTPPPALSRIAYFKGSLVGISSLYDRELYYALPGFPESWPEINVFSSFPLPRNDTLVDMSGIGGSLIISMKEAAARLDELPRTVAGSFIVSEIVPIAGAPGSVGPYATDVVNHAGSSHVAWISPEDGVLVTDGHRWDTISRDLDWTQFDGFDKSAWVLRWMTHLRALVMAYSSTAGGGNDRYYIFHLGSTHLKNGRDAKITGPHYGAIADMTSGVVSNTSRVFEGHWSDGKVYLNMDSSTGQDASQSYSGTISPFIVKGRRAYESEKWESFSVIDAKLRHTDFGAGSTGTVAYTVGRDEGSGTSTKTATISLNRQGGTQFEVSRHGEWHEEEITHLGTARGAILDMTTRVVPTGPEGTAKVV